MEENSSLKAVSSRVSQEDASLKNKEFKQHLIHAIIYLVMGLMITEITAISIHKIPAVRQVLKNHLLVTALASMILLIVNTAVLRDAFQKQQNQTKLLCAVLHSVLVGIPQIVLNIEKLPLAVVYTTILVLLFLLLSVLIDETIIGLFIPSLEFLHIVVLLMSAYYIAFSHLNDPLSSMVKLITLHGGFVIFSGLLVSDAFYLRKIVSLQKFDPLIYSILMHTDVINILFRSAIFISMGQKEPKRF